MKDIKEYISMMHDSYACFDKSYLDKYDSFDVIMLDSLMHYFKFTRDEHYSAYNVFEAHGVFPKCREIAEFLNLFLVAFGKQNDTQSILFMCNDIEELKNDYFNVIYLNYDEYLENHAEYDLNAVGDLIDSKLDYITINVDSKLSKNEIYDKLTHELTHAYEDLQRKLNKSQTLLAKTIRSRYKNLDINDDDNDEVKKLKMLLYLLDKSEQNAYIAQFDGILGDKKYANIQQAFNKIYKSKLYRDIKELSSIVEADDEETKSSICDIYRKIYSSNDSNNKILKSLAAKWNNFLEHFRRHIYQCICDHMQEPNAMDHGKEFIGTDKKKEDLVEKIEKEYLNKFIFIE